MDKKTIFSGMSLPKTTKEIAIEFQNSINELCSRFQNRFLLSPKYEEFRDKLGLEIDIYKQFFSFDIADLEQTQLSVNFVRIHTKYGQVCDFGINSLDFHHGNYRLEFRTHKKVLLDIMAEPYFNYINGNWFYKKALFSSAKANNNLIQLDDYQIDLILTEVFNDAFI